MPAKTIVLIGPLFFFVGAVASPTQAQNPITPSHHEVVPRDNAFNPSGGGQLTQAQKDALDAAIKEFENYAKTHPEVVPELRAIQEVRDKDRFRRGGPRIKGIWRTLPDRYKPCPANSFPCWAYWEKPNESGGGGSGGGDFGPRTILIGDRTVEGCDPRQPQRNCLRRALAIISLFREGGRCLQGGLMEHGDKDCDLLVSLNRGNVRTQGVIDDLVSNGVPASPHGQACQLDAQEKAALNSVKNDLQRQIDNNCKDAQNKNCNPMPVGC